MWFGPLGVLVVVTPKFMKIFESFGAELPRLTILVLSLSDLFTQRWYVGFPILAGVLGILLAWSLARPSRAHMVIGLVLIVGSMVAMAMIVVALFLPLPILVNNMQG